MMIDVEKIISRVFSVANEAEFENLAIEIFRIQSERNVVYSEYLRNLGVDSRKVRKIEEIPFLPIQFFKNKEIRTDLEENQQVQMVFKSSGTTTQVRSRHNVYNKCVYERAFLRGFEKFFGSPDNYVIKALLPSYIEAGNSSLVYMVDYLIEKSGKKGSGFYLKNYEQLLNELKILKNKGEKVILFGVSYALTDMAETINENFNNLIIIETGGMKGRKKELTREELHTIIKKGFGVEKVCSEYGMTELFSQAYSIGNGKFECSDTMKIMIRDINDPFSYLERGSGGINVIDLANIYTCSFIETQDIGRLKNGKFEVLGRIEGSDIRGCNLLIV